MQAVKRIIFGESRFHENEELVEFRYRLLIVVLLTGAFFTCFFLIANQTHLQQINGLHVWSMKLFALVSLSLWLTLRGNPQRLYYIAWIYEIVCLIEYSLALVNVPQDELRVFWFATNIPGVYIILGKCAGAIISTLIILGLTISNHWLATPYSHNAIATLIVSMAYIATFFHFFVNRSLSYYFRMSELNTRLRHLASHDAMTQVLNAGSYYQLCDQHITQAGSTHQSYAVMFIDLDHFKTINDTYGHSAGDTVLKKVAACLTDSIRPADLLGRVGGEEFSVFLPNTTLDQASDIAETIRTNIARLALLIGEQQISITTSIGVAASQNGLKKMRDIQQEADKAMYRAKSEGRNKVTRYEADSRHAVLSV